ncbi:FAD binding domain-containing protein [Halorussus halobius]|uniref:FAD binding domain-containing protein n=1 Tax=Halorussus halobius TaxID=1710537 RepID=UPI001092DA6A|nr:xanthine dehydrogenase family protein subunit M [Halorussus halobius]
MFPEEFDYHRATSVEEALELLATHADEDGDPEGGDADVAVLAGGQGLLPAMKARESTPDVVVDVSDLDSLRGVEAPERGGDDDADGSLAVGALATHATLADSPAAGERATVLAATAGEVADRQIRNRGTVGGNLVEAHPAADLPAATVAADATLALAGPDGERAIPAEEFFEGDGETAIENGELLTEIRVPSARAAGGAYAKKPHPASGFALVGVAASVAVRDWTVTDARVVASGATDAPARLRGVEDALVGGGADRETIADATERAGEDVDPKEARADATASGEFRVHLLSSYAERAVTSAVERATGRAASAEPRED